VAEESMARRFFDDISTAPSSETIHLSPAQADNQRLWSIYTHGMTSSASRRAWGHKGSNVACGKVGADARIGLLIARPRHANSMRQSFR